jgi:outer membrane protein assembly factor BamD
MRIKGLIIFLVISCGYYSCTNFALVQKSDNVDFKYKSAVKYYQTKQYSKAATLFEELNPILKGQADAEKAQYYYAYCQYYMNQLVLSAYYFKKFYESFPRSEFAEEAYYMHCISLYEDSPQYELDQTNTHQAIDAIQIFLERFPKTRYLEDCNKIVDKLLYKLELKAYSQAKLLHRMRDYRASIVMFENMIKDFPSSKYLEEAYFLKVEAQYNFANISIDTKKKERYQTAIDFYYYFIDKYPTSKYLKDAEKIYENIQIKMQEHFGERKKSWWDWLL